MNTTTKNRGAVRVSCEMSPQLSARLIEIAEASHLSVSDVLRRAVALIDLAYQAKLDGHKLGLLDSNRVLITEYTNVL
ncbi:hypothetical protein KY495_20495 [Massilia sp. PAMC28688]|uniref:hypothetical protein n=1 Tax=Massilia sp. PAMC28688 TaxID=2861283 RepID=UPI001C62994F|nr:hypothetical protein [Massilia sp. PAMC28688]QYF93052.1 hypothetical protein KY495_20495 [Massilia sp. PAMC28688]